MDRVLEPVIRNAAYALIVRDNQALLLHKGGDERGERYALPGGAQDPGETLQQALQRECQEEIGSEVNIQDLVHVADYFKQRPGPPPTTRHQIMFLFRCSVPDSYEPHNGPHPDGHQLDVCWVNLDRLGDIPLLPKSLAPLLVKTDKVNDRVYQGLFT